MDFVRFGLASVGVSMPTAATSLSLTLFSDWAEARPRVLALVALERTD